MSCIDREELDAVSNHISNLPTIGALYAPVLVKHCCALLAEVERLTAEVVAKTQQNVALIGQNGRLQQEVERLNALGAFQSADIQRLTRRVAEDEELARKIYRMLADAGINREGGSSEA